MIRIGTSRLFGARRNHLLGAAIVAGAVFLAALATAAQRGPTRQDERFRNPYAWPSLSELVERSETIVAGEVLDMRSSWTADRRQIFTTVTLRTDRRLKARRRGADPVPHPGRHGRRHPAPGHPLAAIRGRRARPRLPSPERAVGCRGSWPGKPGNGISAPGTTVRSRSCRASNCRRRARPEPGAQHAGRPGGRHAPDRGGAVAVKATR